MKLEDLEQYCEEQDIYSDYSEHVSDIEYRILLEDNYISIPALTLNIHSAIYESFDEDSQEFEIDFDFYMFFNNETGELVYEEQGSALETCIHNYCNIVEKDPGYIGDLEIEVKTK